MHIQPLEISEIMTETSTEPSSLICEDDEKEVLNMQEGDFEKEKVGKEIHYFPH